MEQTNPDTELLSSAAQRLGTEPEALMARYYGSPGDVALELEQFRSTGRLQPSFAELLRLELAKRDASAE